MPDTIRSRLWEVAVDQYGYVTSEDAAELSIPVVELGKLSARGRLQRISYGIYRFGEYPASARDTYMLAVLWTGRRGLLSHDSALEAYELCDVNPAKIHLTVPPNYRPRRVGGELYVVHHEPLTDAERGWWEGIPTVRPDVAIRQAIEGKAVPLHLVLQAIQVGRDRGMLSKKLAASYERQLRGGT